MARLLRVSITGTLPSGEEWSVNPVYGIGGDFGMSVTNDQARQVALAVIDFSVSTGLLQVMSTGSAVTGARVEARNIAGVLEAQGEALQTSARAGTGSATHPFQSALVISLRTGLAGARGRGRLYWPATGAPLDASTLRLTSAAQSAFLSGAETYLSGIETQIETILTPATLCVWSRVSSALNPVLQLQVGNVLDVQRRRRDTLIESYSSIVYSA